jgi:hypothetical protein
MRLELDGDDLWLRGDGDARRLGHVEDVADLCDDLGLTAEYDALLDWWRDGTDERQGWERTYRTQQMGEFA